MILVVTRNAPGRVRGLLASCMTETSPGVYTAPHMTPKVRKKVWDTVCAWVQGVADASITMVSPSRELAGRQEIRTFRTPRKATVCVDGVYLSKRRYSGAGVTPRQG